MIYRNPFELPGRFYRGNAHTHSTCSDGAVPPEMRVAQYKDSGYDFLAITDHDVVTSAARWTTDAFLALPGVELHPPNRFGGEVYHLVGLGVSRMIDARRMSANDVLTAVADQGGLAVFAHPYWSGHTLGDFARLRGYCALEVYNTTSCVSIGKGYSESHWDDHLDRIGPVLGLAVDDAHAETADVFQGWIMVKATELTVPAILAAIREGAFYSTQGPEILDIRVVRTERGPLLRAVTSPARRIVFKSRTYNGACVDAKNGQCLRGAECLMQPGHIYLRVEVTAPDGRKAWSNPFFVSDYLQAT